PGERGGAHDGGGPPAHPGRAPDPGPGARARAPRPLPHPRLRRRDRRALAELRLHELEEPQPAGLRVRRLEARARPRREPRRGARADGASAGGGERGAGAGARRGAMNPASPEAEWTAEAVVRHLMDHACGRYARASGPGGQRRDHAETRAELHVPRAALDGLPEDLAERLGAALGLDRRPLRLTAQAERSRERNRALV